MPWKVAFSTRAGVRCKQWLETKEKAFRFAEVMAGEIGAKGISFEEYYWSSTGLLVPHFPAVTDTWCDTMQRPASACGCPDCGPALVDYEPGD